MPSLTHRLAEFNLKNEEEMFVILILSVASEEVRDDMEWGKINTKIKLKVLHVNE